MKNTLNEFIYNNLDEMFISGGTSTKEIEISEETLNVKLENEYKSYLMRYGMIMGFGVEILGFGKNGKSPMVEQTLRFRKMGLENCYIVINNLDEWIDCLNVNTGAVSSWDAIDKNHIIVSDSFYEYVIKELVEAKEDW
ncbi:MAG: SMI1/KNR4 family protein [Ruminococcus sp.]|nr:SMI1/KNR4 family protein [Ruminococcus sp.]